MFFNGRQAEHTQPRNRGRQDDRVGAYSTITAYSFILLGFSINMLGNHNRIAQDNINSVFLIAFFGRVSYDLYRCCKYYSRSTSTRPPAPILVQPLDPEALDREELDPEAFRDNTHQLGS